MSRMVILPIDVVAASLELFSDWGRISIKRFSCKSWWTSLKSSFPVRSIWTWIYCKAIWIQARIPAELNDDSVTGSDSDRHKWKFCRKTQTLHTDWQWVTVANASWKTTYRPEEYLGEYVFGWQSWYYFLISCLKLILILTAFSLLCLTFNKYLELRISLLVCENNDFWSVRNDFIFFNNFTCWDFFRFRFGLIEFGLDAGDRKTV